MFLDNSRYAKTPTDPVTTADGRPVTALRLRRLPPETGIARLVRDGDRLDVMAEAQYGDGTRFWHIADANTALQASDLVSTVLDTLSVPKS